MSQKGSAWRFVIPPQVAPSWLKESRHITRAASLIQGIAHGQSAMIQHMRIHHRRLHIVVAQQWLHRPDIVALLEQMRRNAVPKGMTTDACGEPCRTTGLANDPLQPTFMGVMPANDSCTGVFRQLVGGKHVWPQPKAAGTGVFSCQRKRYIDRANPLRDILRMAALDVRDMFLERYDQVFRQHRHPILHAVAIAHDALLWREIEACRASPQTFHSSHGRVVESGGHSRTGCGEGSHHLQGFRRGQHRRHSARLSGLDSLDGPAEQLSDPIAGDAQQGTEGLVVGGGGDLLLNHEVRQKRLDVCASHVFGMALSWKNNVPFDPGDLGLLRMKGIVLESDGFAYMVEPCLGTWFHGLSRPEIMG
jgi:hypothetical protein